MRHQLFQPLQASLFLLRADHPPTHGFSVVGWLRPKETPSGFIRLQEPVVRLFQVHASLLVRVDARLVLSSGFIGFQAGRLHQPSLDEYLGTFDVNAAPDAHRFGWREANRVAETVNALPNAVDPAEAEGFIDRLGPGDAWLARAYLVIADQQHIGPGMMPFQPRAEGSRRPKVSWLHGRLETQLPSGLGERTNDGARQLDPRCGLDRSGPL